MGTFLAALALIFMGAFLLLGYMIKRMLSSSEWDSSNMTNALRLISHTVVHPDDFPKMFYLTPRQRGILAEQGQQPKRPFWYVNLDELSDVVSSRPPVVTRP